jgi:hypothetical protein
MKIDEIAHLMKQRPDNNNKYFSPASMFEFAENILNMEPLEGILITPFLIETKGEKRVMEMQYYYLDVEIEKGESHLVAWENPSALAKEITDNIKPRANVAPDDRKFYQDVVMDYLEKMNHMNFLEEADPEFIKDSKLYYEIVGDRPFDEEIHPRGKGRNSSTDFT